MVVKVLGKDIILEDLILDRYKESGQPFVASEYEFELLENKLVSKNSSVEDIKTELLKLLEKDLDTFNTFKKIIETP